MRIAAKYSFNDGEAEVTRRFPRLIPEVNAAIKAIRAADHKDKESKEKTMKGRMLFSPSKLNRAFKAVFIDMGWHPVRVPCDYPTTYYLDDYKIHLAERAT